MAKLKNLTQNRQGLLRDLRSQCPNSCQSTFYKLKVKTEPIIDPVALPAPNNTLTASVNDIQGEFSPVYQLNVYLQSDQIKYTQQLQAYDMNQLLSDIGGIWGLFTGSSLLTLLYLLDYLLHKHRINAA
jgi:hypothetical protein